jgi:hypothetical protein
MKHVVHDLATNVYYILFASICSAIGGLFNLNRFPQVGQLTSAAIPLCLFQQVLSDKLSELVPGADCRPLDIAQVNLIRCWLFTRRFVH